ncbi:MAG: lipoyl synthase [Thermodesulfobacteriota bacterium]
MSSLEYMDYTNNHHKTRSKPDWFRQKLPKGANFARTKQILSKHGLCTVCEEAKCPNAGTCFSDNTATFLIMGPNCSRDCAFCAVNHGPLGQPDPGEGNRVAQSARDLGLDYVVVTSVTRDDLPDGGASCFADTIGEIKQLLPRALVEVLIPDLLGSKQDLRTVLQAGPDVLNHNLETVSRLYPQVRPSADYQRSLEILRLSREMFPDIPTKSGLMLGLGESGPEVEATLQDLLSVDCRVLTMGQYLQPSRMHIAVDRYVPPLEFWEWKDKAQEMGFLAVASGPRVRSSYKAKELYQTIYKTRESK